MDTMRVDVDDGKLLVSFEFLRSFDWIYGIARVAPFHPKESRLVWEYSIPRYLAL